MFQFTKDCMLGIEQIDQEHEHLFELIQEGMDMLHGNSLFDQYEEIKAMIARLEDYAEQHFAHEEAYMESICDPELILQRVQHLVFREKIRGLSFVNIDQEDAQTEVLQELMNYLAKWLYHHILGSDIMIGKLPPLEKWMVKENPCEFTEEYHTGIELIDAEHRELFAIVDKAYRLVRTEGMEDREEKQEAVMKVLDQLKVYTKEHFQDEEEYMESIRYDGLEAQKRAHEAFVDKIEHISLEELRENPDRYLESLLEFLLGWLVNHILYTDKKIPGGSSAAGAQAR